LRLKDGQTEIIGGLIQDEDKHDIAGFPGLVELPLFGRLFGKQTDTKNKKEIIMSITPRIIRNNRQVDSDLLEMWSGTENNMRFGARQLGSQKLQATVSTVTQQPAAGSVSVPAPAPASAAPATSASVPAAAALVGPATGAAAPSPRTGLAPPVTPRPLVQSQRSPVAQAAAVTTPKAAPLKPLIIAAPQNVNVGETIGVTVSFPPLTSATSLEASISFDADRLRLVNVTDAESAKNAAQGIRFTGEAEGNSAIRIELAAGRGETLPANGGPLARLQFEVLSTTGPTQLNIDTAAYISNENGSQSLPSVPPTELDVKPKP
jgi:general secretion pathway protein D